ncbi:hypothetical protein [Paraflavitalea sp. CAU 1676]|uniref:hypothetical protein n=1 Tax=Paraflavitalea sp. CAU 1676 TaxID=3032598 RepID=UPI0023DC910A|nr:hypothetical protein [Paraflavitalea sp. CAU 1676]MDF2188235.1 hypothetical protein [Paraflavitalea sp. CAU 1676]
MKYFTAQVELHQAGADDYRQLIRAMKRELFITGHEEGYTGNLTFKRKATVEIKEVIDAVLRAAASTGRRFSFTVMKDKQATPKEERNRWQLR